MKQSSELVIWSRFRLGTTLTKTPNFHFIFRVSHIINDNQESEIVATYKVFMQQIDGMFVLEGNQCD